MYIHIHLPVVYMGLLLYNAIDEQTVINVVIIYMDSERMNCMVIIGINILILINCPMDPLVPCWDIGAYKPCMVGHNDINL